MADEETVKKVRQKAPAEEGDLVVKNFVEPVTFGYTTKSTLFSTTSKQTVYPPHKITPAPPQPFVVPPQSYPIPVAKLTQTSSDKTQDDIVEAKTCQITRKRKEDWNEGDRDAYNSSLKKTSRRIYWTREMHLEFLAAVNQLGIDKADSNKILELMNVENLTRENVDQHLEHYKMRLEGPPKTRMEVVYSTPSAEPMVSVIIRPCS